MTTADTLTWTRHLTADRGLALLLPPTWQLEPPNADYVLAASPTEEIDPIIVVTREPRHESWTNAADYMPANVVRLQRGGALQDYVDGGGGRWTIDGHPVAWHAYDYTSGGGRPMRVLVFHVVADDAAYVISCSGFRENAERLEPTVTAIGHTLRLTGAWDPAGSFPPEMRA